MKGASTVWSGGKGDDYFKALPITISRQKKTAQDAPNFIFYFENFIQITVTFARPVPLGLTTPLSVR